MNNRLDGGDEYMRFANLVNAAARDTDTLQDRNSNFINVQ